jgi:hypothetical protein
VNFYLEDVRKAVAIEDGREIKIGVILDTNIYP